MVGVLDRLRAQYEALRERERQGQEKAKGDQLAVERVKLEKDARAKDAPPSERLFDGIKPHIADRLRNPENEQKMGAEQEQQQRENPTQMKYEPTGLQRGPSQGGGVTPSYTPSQRVPAGPQPDKLLIQTNHPQGLAAKEPLPHERLAAQLQKAPKRDLIAEVRARREAQTAAERSREQQRGLQGRGRGD